MKALWRAGLLAALLVTFNVPIQAQTTNATPHSKSSAAQEPAKPKTPKAGPFHGKLAALNKADRTITVGKRTFQITSETKIRKAGQPATLEQGVVGEPVSGYVKPGEKGKWLALSVNFGPKPAKTR